MAVACTYGDNNMKLLILIAGLLGLSLSTSGCALGAAAGAGAVAADEVSEDDGEFDPLEEAYDDNPDTQGPLDVVDD